MDPKFRDDPEVCQVSDRIETLTKEELRNLVDDLERKLAEAKSAAPKAVKELMAAELKRLEEAERALKEAEAQADQARRERKMAVRTSQGVLGFFSFLTFCLFLFVCSDSNSMWKRRYYEMENTVRYLKMRLQEDRSQFVDSLYRVYENK